MATGGNTYNTKSPQNVGDLFALHQSFDGFMQYAQSADWDDKLKKVVTDSIDKDIAMVESSIVAELNAQMQAGKVDPGGVSFQGVNYTLEDGQLIVEEIPDASTLTLLTTPFGGGTATGGGTGGTTTTPPTTGGTGTDTTAGGAGGGTPPPQPPTDTTGGGTGVDPTTGAPTGGTPPAGGTPTDPGTPPAPGARRR